MQQPDPDDYVIASGEQHSVREFVEMAFKEVDIEIRWKGKGVDEKGVDSKTGKVLVEVDPTYFRPTEVESLLGDPSKAKEKLGWEPKISFSDMVAEMVREDIQEAKKDEYCKNGGFKTFHYFE